ncbi:MAG TPA: serine kinase [Treponema sp.]|nr:serine kinase [Treponema sp.]
MAQCLIIADDLTGANATGVLLHKVGYSTYTVINPAEVDRSEAGSCDCLLYPTDSRNRKPQDAYKRVYEATTLLKRSDTKLFSKRIDSTLRGNLGQETDAMLDALGSRYIALVAPCFPSSGRIVCGGYMLVNSVPLHKTAAATDPKNPVVTSRVEDIFRSQSKYPVAAVDLESLRRGKEYVRKQIMSFAGNGIRTILFDCITDDDLELIADAGIASDIPFISVGPGPFTATVVKKTITPQTNKNNGSILLVIGSVNPVTKIQVDEILPSRDVFVSIVQPEKLVADTGSREAEIKRITDATLSAAECFHIFAVIGAGIDPDKRIDLSVYEKKCSCSAEKLSASINKSFAEMVSVILEKNPDIRALYTSGGDITVAVCEALEVSGIRLHSEVLPLAAYGELCGGKYNGLKIITKGGMAGDKYALKDCIAYLNTHI